MLGFGANKFFELIQVLIQFDIIATLSRSDIHLPGMIRPKTEVSEVS